jgi:hypothetical protein
VLRERPLDLRQLDAEAAHLDLAVDAAEVLERAVLPSLQTMAHQIAGRVHPGAGAAREGVGKEGAGGQVRAPEVAAGEA